MLHRRIPLALVLAALVASVTWSACGGGGGPTCQPSAETCNGLDDDCDGQTDEGFDVGASCTVGIGACAVSGQKVCSASGAATECSAVAGTPSAETCNQVDDDCDGQTDNGLPGCCQPSATRACGADMGVCQAGVETCSAAGAWGACLLAGQPVILPGTQAESCNGQDDDCDGQTDEPDATGCTTFYEDRDADTYGTGSGACLCAATDPFTATVAGDCDDTDATVRPGAAEACNGKDDDCNGQTDEGFGLGAPCSAGVGACVASGQTVCSPDGTAVVCSAVPGAAQTETCNGVDDDCDGQTDEGLSAPPCPNQLGVCAGSHQSCGAAAGWLACAAADYGPDYQATETLCDAKDNDCDGSVDEGFTLGASCSAGIGACQRTGVTVCSAGGTGVECGAVPGVPTVERCNGIDDDCDGATDEDFPSLGAPCTAGTGICFAAGVYVCAVNQLGTTCNAAPGAPQTEVCNGIDDDCDGQTDEAVADHPLCAKQSGACAGATKPSALCQGGVWGACTDAVYAAYSAAYEPLETRCDGLDNDCDGQTDEGLSAPACAYQTGVCAGSRQSCGGASGWLACGPANYGPNYQAVEVTCDGLDNDCDGQTDEGVVGPACENQNGVCAGATKPSALCQSGAWLACSAAVYAAYSPYYQATTETLCDGKDNDCDGSTDEGFGLGTACIVGTGACTRAGVVVCKADGTGATCSVTPGAPQTELCGNGLDDDCDGSTDEGFAGLGTSCTVGTGICAATGTVICSTDRTTTTCSATAGAPQTEVCNGLDDNCNGLTDEAGAAGCITYYTDVDGDGYGRLPGACLCAPNAPFTATVAGDCDDTRAAINPGASERCGNGLDDDCDGMTDESPCI